MSSPMVQQLPCRLGTAAITHARPLEPLRIIVTLVGLAFGQRGARGELPSIRRHAAVCSAVAGEDLLGRHLLADGMEAEVLW